MVGEGDVIVDLGGPSIPVVTGATVVSLVGDQLDLRLTGLGQHDVSLPACLRTCQHRRLFS